MDLLDFFTNGNNRSEIVREAYIEYMNMMKKMRPIFESDQFKRVRKQYAKQYGTITGKDYVCSKAQTSFSISENLLHEMDWILEQYQDINKSALIQNAIIVYLINQFVQKEIPTVQYINRIDTTRNYHIIKETGEIVYE
jgi:metal-responsive CopG/Arc/MetJ family transcriptional regulator